MFYIYIVVQILLCLRSTWVVHVAYLCIAFALICHTCPPFVSSDAGMHATLRMPMNVEYMGKDIFVTHIACDPTQ